MASNLSTISKSKKDERPLPYKASIIQREEENPHELTKKKFLVSEVKVDVELDELLYKSFMVQENREVQS